MNTIIALDIGYRFTGVVVYDLDSKQIVATDCIRVMKTPKASKALEHFDDCQTLAEHLDFVINKWNPEHIYAESPTGGGKSSNAVKSMASSVAILASVTYSLGIPVTLVTPLQLKRLVRAKGAVDKYEIMELVERKLTTIGFKYPYQYKWAKDHTADAAAILLFLHEQKIIKLSIK